MPVDRDADCPLQAARSAHAAALSRAGLRWRAMAVRVRTAHHVSPALFALSPRRFARMARPNRLGGPGRARRERGRQPAVRAPARARSPAARRSPRVIEVGTVVPVGVLVALGWRGFTPSASARAFRFRRCAGEFLGRGGGSIRVDVDLLDQIPEVSVSACWHGRSPRHRAASRPGRPRPRGAPRECVTVGEVGHVVGPRPCLRPPLALAF